MKKIQKCTTGIIVLSSMLNHAFLPLLLASAVEVQKLIEEAKQHGFRSCHWLAVIELASFTFPGSIYQIYSHVISHDFSYIICSVFFSSFFTPFFPKSLPHHFLGLSLFFFYELCTTHIFLIFIFRILDYLPICIDYMYRTDLGVLNNTCIYVSYD